MGILETAKEVSELAKKYNDLDLYQKIIDLRDEIFTLREENLSMKEKLKDLQSAFEIKGNIKRDGNAYYHIDTNGQKSGPYCLTCWDDDKKLINLVEEKDVRGKHFKCFRCHKLSKNN